MLPEIFSDKRGGGGDEVLEEQQSAAVSRFATEFIELPVVINRHDPPRIRLLLTNLYFPLEYLYSNSKLQPKTLCPNKGEYQRLPGQVFNGIVTVSVWKCP